MGKKQKQHRNQEPITIDTDITGTHGTGNFLGPPDAPLAEIAERVRQTGLIWADQDDHAKEGMTNRDSGPATHNKAETRP